MAVWPLWHHFWTLIFFELFGDKIDFFHKIDRNDRKVTKINQKLTKIGFYVRIWGHFWFKMHFWVKITMVNLRDFEKHKVAHNLLNNWRRTVLTPFLDIDILWTFWIKIDFFRQFVQNSPKYDKNRPKNNKKQLLCGVEAIFRSRYIFWV